jgi:hypothetical protein
MLRLLLAILSAFSLVVGLLFATGSWRDQRDFQKISERGDHAMARIARAYPDTPRSGQPPSYLVELQWTDSVGREHIYGPTHISAHFWRQITTNGVLTTRQTEIAALPENVSARPVILYDIKEHEFQDELGLKSGIAFLLFGSALGSFLILPLFKNRRARARSVDAVYDAQQQMNKWRHAMGALLANEANAVFVREMIHRLEESGLRIDPTLNRALVTTGFYATAHTGAKMVT